MDDVEEFINSLSINPDELLIVACSGGPDSMFLLNYLWERGYKLVCAHVNHNMREASKDEYQFVKNFCEERNIIFEGTEINQYSDDNFHDFARNYRYNFFSSLIEKYHSKYLFTAHHGDDLMETILMRLVRGSTLKGYAGFMSIVDKENYKIIRPLIYLTKEEIENMDKENNIPYVVDESNLEDHYTRNRYRHVVLPFLKSEEKNVHTKFLNFSNTINEVQNYFDKIVMEIKSKIYSNGVLNISEFKSNDNIIQKFILENILSDWYPDDLFLINNKHIDEIFKIINSNNKKNCSIVLPNNLIVTREYNNLIFSKDKAEFNKIDTILDEEVVTNIGVIKKVNVSDDTSNYTIRLNSKDIKLPLRIVSRSDGMKIAVKNMMGSKKINDIFIDMKIPKSQRENWPILIDSNNTVLWVPGLKKSNLDVVIDKDYDIIITCAKWRKNL